MGTKDDWLTIKQTVARIEELGPKISEKFLYRRRRDGTGPPYWQNGKKIYYKSESLPEWSKKFMKEG